MSKIKVALDFCLSRRLVGALDHLYGDSGYEFLHLSKIVPNTSSDQVWADAYRRFGGRIVLSGDSRIAYRPHQALAFQANGLVSFFPDGSWGQLRGHEKSAFMIYWWPAIELKAQSAPDGTSWRLPCNSKKGDLRLVGSDLIPLVIPDEVLKKTSAPTRGAA